MECVVEISIGELYFCDIVNGEQEDEVDCLDYWSFEFYGFVLYGCDLGEDFNIGGNCDYYCGCNEVGLGFNGYVDGVYVVCLYDEVDNIDGDYGIGYVQVIEDWFVGEGGNDVVDNVEVWEDQDVYFWVIEELE